MSTKSELREIKFQLESSNDELRRRIENLEKKLELNNKLNDSKIEKIKKRTCELLEVSTSHGIPNIVRSKNIFIQVIWCLFTILATFLGLYFVIDSVLEYLKYNTVSKFQAITEPEIPFPAISICGLPSFNTSLDQTVFYSKFDDIHLNISQYFLESNNTALGKCFIFNSGRNIYNQSYDIHNSTKKGTKDGFKIGIKLETISDDFFEIILSIYNQTTINKRDFIISSGSYNYFELDRVFYKKLAAPYSNCLEDINLFEMNKKLINYLIKYTQYSQDECFYLCSQLFALQESKCNCNSTLNDFTENCIRKINSLFETNEQKCIAKYLKDFRKKYQNEKCSKYCPLECDSMKYIINTYNEQFPLTGNISKKVNFPAEYNTYEEIKKHYIEIFVYYNDLKYTVISEEPKAELFNFVSNIGGILGLFLGISFLSFIEILEILFEILIIIFKQRQ
jgi:hypothetical protein